MRKALIGVLCVLALSGCGNETGDVTGDVTENTSSEAETESTERTSTKEESELDPLQSENPFESEDLTSLAFHDIEFQVPESWWDKMEETDSGSEIDYEEGTFFINAETTDMGDMQFFSDDEKEDFSDSVELSIENMFYDYEIITDYFRDVNNGTLYRVKAYIESDFDWYIDMLFTTKNGYMYFFSVLAPKEDREFYEEVFDSLRKTIELNETQGQDPDEYEEAPDLDHEYEISGGDIEVVADYFMSEEGMIFFDVERAIIIKNNSSTTYDINIFSVAYNEDGEAIETDEDRLYRLPPGYVSVVYQSYLAQEKICSYFTEIEATVEKEREPILQDLSYTQSNIDSGAVFSVTNQSDEDAIFVYGHALFFLENELVDYDSKIFGNDVFYLESGETASEEITTQVDFDRIEFYLTGGGL